MEIDGLYQKSAAEENSDIIKFKSPISEVYEKAMPNSREKMKKATNLIPFVFVVLILLSAIGLFVYFL